MGYTRHHAIVCAGPVPIPDDPDYHLVEAEFHGDFLAHYASSLRRAHERATAIFGDMVSPIIAAPRNGLASFFVAPDGSYQGFGESDAGDARRAEFIAYLRSEYYEDGSSAIKWAEVQYGDDENEAKVTQSSDFDEAAYWETHAPA